MTPRAVRPERLAISTPGTAVGAVALAYRMVTGMPAGALASRRMSKRAGSKTPPTWLRRAAGMR